MFFLYSNYRINKAYIRYTLDGETLHSPYTDTSGATRYFTLDNHYIYSTNSTSGNSASCAAGGYNGGGSGYIGGVSDGSWSSGQETGCGKAVVTYVSP